MTANSKPPKIKLGQKKEAVTRRRNLFVERYLINGNNATEAAKHVGFSDKTACREGWRMLKHPEVKALLGDRAEQVVHDARLTTEKWAKEMACIGHFDPGELYDTDGALIPIHKLPEHVRKAISSVKQTQRREGKGEDAETVTETEVKIWDKNTALANIGRHLGVFDKDNQQRNQPIQIAIQLVG